MQTPLKPESKDFRKVQYAFASHIRDPDNNAAPGDIEDRRMAIYRDLFYNNIEGFISSNFPVMRTLFVDADWHAMIRDFMANHESHTPYFPEFAKEFIDYLEHERHSDTDPEFLVELAHHEWVETALALDETDIDRSQVDSDASLLDSAPVVSPLAWPLSYRFPVHQITAEYQPEAATDQPTYLLIYRNEDDEICFMDLNPVTFRLLQIIEQTPELTGRQALQQIADEMDHPNPETVIQGGAEILNQLRDRSVILGACRV